MSAGKSIGLGVVAVAVLGALAYWLLQPPGSATTGEAPAPSAAPAPSVGEDAQARPAPPIENAWRLRGYGSVEGILREYGTDRALGGVKVLLAAGVPGPGDTLEATTLPDGSFEFPKVPNFDGWTLHARVAPPLAELEMAGVSVSELRLTDLGILYATPGFTVPGIVVDQAGLPVKGALVRAVRTKPVSVKMDFLRVIRELPRPNPAVDTATTADDGRFVLKKTTPGTYDVEVSAKGYRLTVELGVLVGPDSSTREIRVVLAGGHILRGRVVRKTEGPLEGLPVVAIPQPQDDRQLFDTIEKSISVTNETGEFTLEGLGAGTYVVGVEVANEPYYIADDIQVPREGFVEIVIDGDCWLEGTVRDAEGTAVVGAQVYVANFRSGAPSVAFAQTDAAGHYMIRSLKSGPVQLFMVQAEGFGTFPEDFMPMIRGSGSDLTLKPGKNEKDVLLGKGGIVRGTVMEQGTQTPVEGVRISVTGLVSFFGGSRSGTSDAAGKFEITSVPLGSGLLIASKDGWVQPGLTPQTMLGMAGAMAGGAKAQDPGKGLTVVITRAGEVVERALEMSRGTSLRGVVQDPAGTPVPGARVSVQFATEPRGFMRQLVAFFPLGEPRITGSDGSFDLPASPAGQKVVVIAKAQGWLDGRSEDLAVGTDAIEGVVVRLRQGTVLTGTVKGPEGKPLPGVSVRSTKMEEGEDWGRQWRLRSARPWLTDEAGVYRITGIDPGKLVVQFTHPNTMSLSRLDVVAEEGKTVEISVELEGAPSIGGKVLGPDGKAFSGARVQLDWQGEAPPQSDPYWSPPQDLRSGSDGSFTATGLVAGRYKIVAQAEGAADSDPVEADAGWPAVTLRLAPAYLIAGTVRTKRGEALSNVRVRADRTGGGGDGSANTNREGRFEIRDLPAGTYDVRAEPGWGVGSSRPNLVPVTAPGVQAGVTDLVLEAEEGLRITGVVLRGDGTPVAEGWYNATQILPAGDTSRPVQTNGPLLEGRLEISGLAPGKYNVGVGGNDIPWKQVTLEAGAENVKIQYGQGGSIEGRVLKPDGNPATDTWITATGSDGVSGAPVGKDGKFNIRELPAGNYAIAVALEIDGKAHHATAKDISVSNGAATPLGDLVVAPVE